jgi:aspartyl-tRNA(Asn)/glutamyl-tRNA(Gln) amidotransferase subunit A
VTGGRPSSGVPAPPGLEGIFLARPEEPPDGIPLAVKDLFDTAGLVTTYGSAIFADHVPARSAEAVRRLEAAGYAVVGKTNLHEFAYGTSSENPHYGTIPNPLAPGHMAGGSSGGSAAALAAGLADAALGTDSGGSIRLPAAWCGVTGFKPTYGLVPVEGVFPLAPSYDHAGPMARSVAGCTRMLQALVPGFEPADLDSLADLRVAVAWLELAEPLVAARVQEAAQRFPHPDRVEFPSWGERDFDFRREVADVHRELFAEHGDLYGEEVARKIELSLQVTDDEVVRSAEARRELRERAAAAIEPYDLLVTPTTSRVAPPLGRGDLRKGALQLTYPFNALGWPALALPCGPAEDGLHASVQLVAPAGGDALVLAAGELLQAALASPF